MKYFMIHGAGGGQLGTWAAETEEEALEMLAREAGYASKAGQDEALRESGEPTGQEKVEEITRDEYRAIDRLLEEGYHQQGQALDAYREAKEIGDTWMLNSICDGLGDWKGINYPRFLQALVNANAEPWPTFYTEFEDEVATKAAWERLQAEESSET